MFDQVDPRRSDLDGPLEFHDYPPRGHLAKSGGFSNPLVIDGISALDDQPHSGTATILDAVCRNGLGGPRFAGHRARHDCGGPWGRNGVETVGDSIVEREVVDGIEGCIFSLCGSGQSRR